MEADSRCRTQQVPISLGKPSLRRRLEDYYTMVAPDQLQHDWIDRFQHIWKKYGGSHEGEAKLASKLMKKYGNTVCLLTVASVEQHGTESDPPAKPKQGVDVYDESFFDVTLPQKGSGQLSILCRNFDPHAVLFADIRQVYKVNPWMSASGAILDRVEQCRTYLTERDPLYQSKTITRKRERTPEKVKALTAFAMITAPFERGPLSVLHKCMTERKRARIIIRYVNCVRGTMTGYIVGFDKHMNMLLRDVDEVYTPRHVEADGQPLKSNLEVEMHRRIAGASGTTIQGQWTLRQRHLKQVMVRGDNVVAVYRAEQERSAWPLTTKSPDETTYRIRTVRRDVPPAERIGTPGSLLYASQKRQRMRHKENYSG